MTGTATLLRRTLAAVAAGLAVATLLGACGGDSGSGAAHPGEKPRSTGGTQGGPELTVGGPSARYAAATEELGGPYQVNPTETYGLSPDTYAASTFFTGATEGGKLAKDWGYTEGYQASLYPDGLLAGVLQGRYYVTEEVHLFATQDGARQAYARYENQYAGAAGSERLQVAGLANQSSAWQFVQGTVGSSEVVAVYHRFLFRRGNMLAVVQTFGGNPFMTIDIARDIAVIIDDRALGKRQATEPTPARTPATVPSVPAR